MRAKAFRSLLFIGMLALAGLACNYVTSLISPSAKPALLTDDFSNSAGGWGTGTDSQSSVEYVDGGLHMKAFQDNFFTWSNPGHASYQDVHLEVTAQNPSADTSPGFGLMCDQQTEHGSYYYFAIRPDGEYVIGKSAAGQDDVFLTNNDKWAISDQIEKSAASYRLGADCGNGTLTFYVDGHEIDSASDATYTDGGVGLFLWSGDQASGEVTYDDFLMTALK